VYNRASFLGLTLLFFTSYSLLPQNVIRETAIDLYRKGLKAQEEENFYLAIENYKSALQENPQYYDPMLGLARSYFALGEYKEVLRWINTAEKFNKNDIKLLILKGRVHTVEGQYGVAESFFKEVLSRQPNNLEANFGLAELHVSMGNLRMAEEQYRKILKIAPENRKALLSISLLYDAFGEEKQAEERILTALRLYGDNPQVHYLASRHYLYANNYTEAETRAKTALSLKENYLDAALLLSEIYLKKGHYEEVIPVIERIAREHNENPLIWYILGVANSKQNRIERSIDYFARALHLNSDDEISRITLEHLIIDELSLEDPVRKQYADYHFAQGSEYERRNLYLKALNEYRRGVALDPYSREGRLLYARIFYKLGYTAKYYSELKVLTDLGYNDREIREELEIFTSLLEDSVSDDWQINQFFLERPTFRFDVFYSIENLDLLHFMGGETLASYLIWELIRFENIEIEHPPENSFTFADSFGKARKRQSDYFIIFKAKESDRDFSCEASIYLSRTGALMEKISLYRTGNKRVADALYSLAEEIHKLLPLRGKIIKRRFEKGVIDLGTLDGVKVDDKLSIVRRGRISLKNNEIGLTFNESDLLGEFTVTRTDTLISEGNIEKKTFFDMINQRDAVVKVQPEKEERRPEMRSELQLFQNLLKIR